VLGSEPYRERVNHPTLWTTQIMARFRNMVRSQCRVTGSEGGGIAHAMLTLRVAPQAGQEQRLREWIVQQLLPALAAKAGITGAHLIENAVLAVPLSQQTAEQKLRGGDTVADWVVLVSGYDVDGLTSLTQNELQDQVLAHHGAAAGPLAGIYRLAYSMSKD
jgi:hypothetical protein